MNDSAIPASLLLTIYSGLILMASLAGGWIPLVVRLTHTRLQVATSFVAGLMLGVGVLHLLPHAWHQLRSIDQAVRWMLGGFLVMFFIQRFFHFHHHDVPEGAGERSSEPTHAPCAASHSVATDPHGHSLAEQSARRLSWTGAAFGLMLHTLLDGVALAASVEASAQHQAQSWLLGIGTFLVVFLHKPFDAMAIGTLMARSGRSKSLRHIVNGLFALGIPVGVLLFHFGARQFSGPTEHFLGLALAFAAGTFLCIAASDLLPELQFHAHDRIKLSLALIAGLALAAFIGAFETTGHDSHESTESHLTTNNLPLFTLPRAEK